MQTLQEVGAGLGEVDVSSVTHTLLAELATLAGDRETLARLVPIAVEFALAHGIPSVLAQAASLWWYADRRRPRRSWTGFRP